MYVGSRRSALASAAGQLAKEPAFGEGPFAFHRRRRDTQRGRGLLDGQAAEEAQLDELRLIGIDLLKLGQRAIEVERIDGIDRRSWRRNGVVQLERQFTFSPFLPQLSARVIDEDTPHQLRGNREEMPTILPVDLALAEQLHVGFVDDHRGLEAIVAPFAREMARGQRVQLVIDQRDEPVERVLTAVLPFAQEASNVSRSGSVGHRAGGPRLVRQCTQAIGRASKAVLSRFSPKGRVFSRRALSNRSESKGTAYRVCNASQEAVMSRLLVGGLMACAISAAAFAQAPTVPAMPKQYQDMAAAIAAAQARAARPGDEALGCAAIERELTQLQANVGPAAANLPAAAASQHALAQVLAAQSKPAPQQAQAMQAATAQQAAAIQQAIAAQQKMTPQQAQATQQALAQAQALSTPQAQAVLQAQVLAAQQPLANPQVQAALQAQAQALASPQMQAALQAQALATPQAQAALAAQRAQLAQLPDPSADLAMMTTVMPQIMRSQRLVGLAMAKGCASLGAAPVVPAKK